MARGDLIQLGSDTGILILTSDDLSGSPVLTGMLATRSSPTPQTLSMSVGEANWCIHLQQLHTIDRRSATGYVATCPSGILQEATETLMRSLDLHR